MHSAPRTRPTSTYRTMTGLYYLQLHLHTVCAFTVFRLRLRRLARPLGLGSTRAVRRSLSSLMRPVCPPIRARFAAPLPPQGQGGWREAKRWSANRPRRAGHPRPEAQPGFPLYLFVPCVMERRDPCCFTPLPSPAAAAEARAPQVLGARKPSVRSPPHERHLPLPPPALVV